MGSAHCQLWRRHTVYSTEAAATHSENSTVSWDSFGFKNEPASTPRMVSISYGSVAHDDATVPRLMPTHQPAESATQRTLLSLFFKKKSFFKKKYSVCHYFEISKLREEEETPIGKNLQGCCFGETPGGHRFPPNHSSLADIQTNTHAQPGFPLAGAAAPGKCQEQGRLPRRRGKE